MQKELFRQLQTIELQDEGKPNVALVFILLTYPKEPNSIPRGMGASGSLP